MAIEDLLERARLHRALPGIEERQRLRKAAGLSLEDVADAIGCSRQALAHWEHGRRVPRGRNLTVYAEVLRALAEAS